MSISQVAKAIDALGVNKRITQAFTQIDETSSDLAGQIDQLADDTNTAIGQASTDFSTQIGQLSTNLSGEISTVASSVSELGSTLGQQISEASSLASSANDNAVTAINTADSANQTAIAASSSASGAAATANSALTIAGTAADTANTAASTASSAESTANSAASDASDALTAASSAVSASIATSSALSALESDLDDQISTISQSVDTVTQTANDASDAAAAAAAAASTASSSATTALSTANTAATNASTALSTANTANSTANTANSTANTALTAANAAVSSIVQPAAGITVSGINTRTLALSDDLLAVEGITGTGIAVRTATNTWLTRIFAGTQDKVTVTNEDGIAGNITITIANTYAGQTSITTLGTVQTGVWNATPIGTAYGGTNITSWTTGDIPYASATNVLSKLADVAAGSVLLSGGIGVAPSYGKVDLTVHITGNLPVSRLNSGTNASATTFWCGDNTWKTISSSATLTSGRIGFGDGSNLLSGSSALTYDDSTHTLQIGAGTGLSIFRTPNAISGANAASLSFITGDANAGAVGAGVIKFQGGAGAGASDAGHLDFYGGDTLGSGSGGILTFNAGNSTSGAKGTVIFKVANTTIATVKATGFEVSALIPTGTTAPTDGIYKKSAGVMGMAANNTAAFMWGSNALVSQTHNSRDLGELATAYRDIFSANAVTVTSDERTKTDIKDSVLGLNLMRLLRAVSYRKIVGQIAVSDDGNNTETLMPGIRTHYGLLSQQVKEALDTLNLGDFAGWVLEDVNNPDSAQALRYEQFICPLIKATQELDTKTQVLDTKIQEFDIKIQELDAKILQLQSMLPG
jgi:hypothetical protein